MLRETDIIRQSQKDVEDLCSHTCIMNGLPYRTWKAECSVC